MLKVYLAGPEVFLPGGRELIERKRALSTRYGFTPSPLHADLTPTASASPLARGIEISRLNEERMREADVCIANLTPFRGVSADPGTVYELGYMAAEGKPVFAYTNDPTDYSARAATYFAGGLHRDDDGVLRGPDGQMIEDHGMADNLMLEGGILTRDGVFVRAAHPLEWDDLSAFERCLTDARRALTGRQPLD